MRSALLLFASFGLVACNSIWGLDEGQIEGAGGGGGGPVTGSTGSNSSGQTTTDGSGGQPAGSGGSGTGGGCVVETGLTNGDFSSWSGSDPDAWAQTKYNAMLFSNQITGIGSGLQFGVTDVGNAAYAGYYQTVSFKSWNQCVRVSGDARKSTGMGRLTAKATFGSEKLEVVTPSGTSFAPFSATCHPSVPVEGFNFTVTLDQLPVGGTVTYEMHSVAFDEVCCTGSEPACPTD